ncbi:semaphorin-7A [Stegastes partitus]|uniref:Semaphorin 7A (John Milton Hagen blood group) n=1 Tax=Stegastes partitus TaxID=144197 RepID=A0A3B5B1R4_9TELE|nr:PREDICTED: semaphorin-7A [Stegastes partitus]
MSVHSQLPLGLSTIEFMRKMRWFVFICIWLTGNFQPVLSGRLEETPTLGNTKTNPRVLSKDVFSGGFNYQIDQNHTVFLYEEDSQELYVGGTGFVFRIDASNWTRVIEKFPLKTTGQEQCQEGPCENVVTVIEKFQDSMFVCGTNGQNPQCWELFPSTTNQSQKIEESYDGIGISPFVYTQNSLLLTIDGDIYAAAPLDADGSSLQFRRKAGSRTNVWMYDSWVSEPTFISASWVQRKDDRDNEKIYVFFREKNSDHSPEADPWISRVARVCKVDEGGSKRFFQNIWTSFLKARLVCGFPDESLYFNRLQDIYVMHAEDWRDTRVYALFTSSWNSTAVCIYSIAMIESIFENSTFKGYNKDMPRLRPGTCVRNSRSLPQATLNVVKDYPEMTDWVYSLHYTAPFYVSSNNYTKIVVDRVQAADQHMYNVLLLATDSGKIHKVLEAGPEPFIISETHLSNSSTIQAMKLDSKKKMLVVGFSERISTVDLRRCQDYNNSCADCVLARDPYCAWTSSGCTSTVPQIEGIQNIMDGQISVCSAALKDQKAANRTKRETASPSEVNLRTVHSVPQGVPFYLSCPIDSYHAEYTWEYGGRSSPCLQMLSDCLHLIPSMAPENYGNYECVSKEKDYTKVVKRYQLTEQIVPEEMTWRRHIPYRRNDASALVPRIWIALTLTALAVWEIFR